MVYFNVVFIQVEKKDVKCGGGGCQGESDRSHSQSRSSSSDKVKHRSGAGGQYRRIGVVSMPPASGDIPETDAAVKMKAEVARRISLDDLSAAFQGNFYIAD